MSEKKQAAGVLRSAARIMVRGGYLQGYLRNAHGAHCALGAVQEVTIQQSREKLPLYAFSVKALADTIRQMVGPGKHKNLGDGVTERATWTVESSDGAVVAGWNNTYAAAEPTPQARAAKVACVMNATAELLEEEAEEEDTSHAA